MLQVLQKKAQGWVAWMVLGAIALTFVLVGTEPFWGNHNQQILVKVNGSAITEEALEAAYQQFRAQGGKQALSSDFKKALLQMLIEQKVIAQATVALQLLPTPLQVSRWIKQHFGEEQSQELLASQQSPALRALLRETFALKQLEQSIVLTALPLESVASELFALFGEKRGFQYMMFPSDLFEKQVTIAPEEVKAYYQAHLFDFMTKEKVALEYILLNMSALAEQQKPSESALEHYYQTHPDLFTEPASVRVAHLLIHLPKKPDPVLVKQAQQQIEDLQKALDEGASFEALVKQYSQDKGTASTGGDLGWLVRGETFPDFEEVAFALEHKDQISQIVQTRFGLHLIKLLDRKEATLKPMEAVKADLYEKVKRQQAEEQFEEMGERLATLVYEEPESLLPAANALGLEVKKTGLFSRETPPEGLQQPSILNAAFRSAEEISKQNSEVMTLDANNKIVIRVAEYVPKTQQTLPEVAERIEKHLKHEKATLLAKAKAETHKAADIEANWYTVSPRTRDDSSGGIPSALVKAAFVLENTHDRVAVPVPQGWAVLRLTEREPADFASFAQKNAHEKEAFLRQLSKEMGEVEFHSYIKGLIAQAKIAYVSAPQ